MGEGRLLRRRVGVLVNYGQRSCWWSDPYKEGSEDDGAVQTENGICLRVRFGFEGLFGSSLCLSYSNCRQWWWSLAFLPQLLRPLFCNWWVSKEVWNLPHVVHNMLWTSYANSFSIPVYDIIKLTSCRTDSYAWPENRLDGIVLSQEVDLIENYYVRTHSHSNDY